MSKIKFSFLSVLVFLLAVNLFAARAPKWVIDGFSKDYPQKDYFYAVGEGTSKTAAELRAIEGIASVFGQNVKSATKGDKRMAMIENQNGDYASATATSIDQTILRQVDAENLIALEIAETYQDEKQVNKWYALAVMNKAKATEIYTDLIEANYSTIKTLIKQTENKDYSLDNFSRLDFAVKLALQNEFYLNRLSIINNSVADSLVKAEYQSVKIKGKLRDFAVNIPVYVNVTSDDDNRISKAFETALTSAGLSTSKGSNERYTITCKVNFTTKMLKGRNFCEYTVDASLNDTVIGESLIPLSFTGREGGNDENQAISRAKLKIADKISETFTKQFNTYLQSLSM
ncbi:MAG: LPP20 family lipoprotein [Treponema sp.]|nr:LPP20 family lipoprotein [Treponema sp.]